MPGSIAAILWTWGRDQPSFYYYYYWLIFAWGEIHPIMFLFWMKIGLKKEYECILLLFLHILPLLNPTSYFCSTILWNLIPESICSLGLTESHLLDSPLLVYSRMWLFLTISYVYSILYAFLCPQICKALSSLVPSVPSSFLSVSVGLFLFVLLYMGKYTG